MYNITKWQTLTSKQLLRYWHKAMGICNILECLWFVDLCNEMTKRKIRL